MHVARPPPGARLKACQGFSSDGGGKHCPGEGSLLADIAHFTAPTSAEMADEMADEMDKG